MREGEREKVGERGGSVTKEKKEEWEWRGREEDRERESKRERNKRERDRKGRDGGKKERVKLETQGGLERRRDRGKGVRDNYNIII